jgi:hypothetical protein
MEAAVNKIVRENYPASKLPEDLREGLDPDATVRVVVQPISPLISHLSRFVGRFANRHVTAHEAVARVRALRDEWD